MFLNKEESDNGYSTGLENRNPQGFVSSSLTSSADDFRYREPTH